jgi:hypothetical protein
MLDAELGERIDDRICDDSQPGVMPPSLPPRMPSGLVVEGTSLISVRNSGKASARGIA